MGLDFWMTWVKKDDSPTVLRSSTGKIFHNILRSFVSSLLFKMYNLVSPLTGESSTWHLHTFRKLVFYSVGCQTRANSW